MQTCGRKKFRRFRQSFHDRPYFGEPLSVPFYTSLNADISVELGKILRTGQQFSSQFVLYFRIKEYNFSFYIHFKAR